MRDSLLAKCRRGICAHGVLIHFSVARRSVVFFLLYVRMLACPVFPYLRKGDYGAYITAIGVIWGGHRAEVSEATRRGRKAVKVAYAGFEPQSRWREMGKICPECVFGVRFRTGISPFRLKRGGRSVESRLVAGSAASRFLSGVPRLIGRSDAGTMEDH